MSTRETVLAKTIFRIVDVEGTDRDPLLSRVVELAGVDMDVHGNMTRPFCVLVNPGIPIPPSASAVHHLVDADVANKPPLEEVAPLYLQPDRIYVAHSAEYDRTVLGLHELPWVCTHRLAMHLWPELENHGNQVIRYTLKLKPRIPPGTPHHRAFPDVMVTAAILQTALPLATAKWPEIRTVGDLIDCIGAPVLLHRIPFKTANGATFETAETSHLEWIVRQGAGGPDCVHTARHWLEKRLADRSGYAYWNDEFMLDGAEVDAP